MSRRALIGAAAVLVIVGIAVVLVVIFRGPSGPERPPLPEGAVPLGPEAQELVSLVRQSHDRTYHAVYEMAGDFEPQDGSVRIELWRKDGLIRQDQILTAGDQTVHTSAFRLSDRTIVCNREGDGPWECSPAGGGVEASPEVDPLLGEVVEELEGRGVAASDQEVAGRPARCFEIVGEGERAELCLDEDGIALAIRAGDAALELVSLQDEVDDDVFEPPAGPS